MVKRLMLSIAALLVAACGFAQDLVPVRDQSNNGGKGKDNEIVPKACALTLGPKVGLNISFAGDPDEMDLGIKGSAGFTGGVAANIRFWKRPLTKFADTGRLGVQLEFLYSMHLLKSDDENINMNCYEIPLLLQWWFARDFCIEIGPTFTGVFSTSPKELEYNNSIIQIEKIKGHDVMFTIGAEYKSRKGFTAGVRYNLGNSDLAGNFQTKVSTISFCIGWLFSIVK